LRGAGEGGVIARPSPTEPSRMRIASWNVNSLNVRMPHLEQWLRAAQPDVIGLQETKLEDAKFPDTAIAALGYRSVFAGQKTYNGVALLARGRALDDAQLGIPDFDDEQKRVIAATVDGVRVVNLYVVNGQDVGTEKYAYKLRWLDAVHDWLRAEIARYPKLVVLGDFNIAPDERDVHDPAIWNENHILTSTAERAALLKLHALGLHDAYRLHHADGGKFSWWDYRQAGFRRDLGLRIDLTLVSDALKAGASAADIDRDPRTWDRPSDHAPVWVEIAG
jgi:exodeoxyribonuclease-3